MEKIASKSKIKKIASKIEKKEWRGIDLLLPKNIEEHLNIKYEFYKIQGL